MGFPLTECEQQIAELSSGKTIPLRKQQWELPKIDPDLRERLKAEIRRWGGFGAAPHRALNPKPKATTRKKD